MGWLSQLLFILGLGQLVNAASIYKHSDFSRGLRDELKPQAPVLPFFDLTRRLQEGPAKPTECIYKGERYLHGERVPTAQPCLNCTCIVPHMLCYLKMCPKVSAPPSGCFAAREVGECCPTLVCGGLDLTKPKDSSDTDPDLRPTFQPARDEAIATDQSLTVEDNPTDTFPPIYSNPTNPTFIDDNSADLLSAEGSPSISNTVEDIRTNFPIENNQTDATPIDDDISTDISSTTNNQTHTTPIDDDISTDISSTTNNQTDTTPIDDGISSITNSQTDTTPIDDDISTDISSTTNNQTDTTPIDDGISTDISSTTNNQTDTTLIDDDISSTTNNQTDTTPIDDGISTDISPTTSNQTDTTPIDDDISTDISSITNNQTDATPVDDDISTDISLTTNNQTDTTPIDDDISTDISSTTNASLADAPHTIKSHPTETAKTVKSSSTDSFQTVDSSSLTSTETIKIHTTPILETKPTDGILPITDSTLHTTLTDEGDSLVYITSTQEPGQDYDTNMFNDIPGGCMVNGTLYGDGSAMLSSTFCEYCFCIRGKTTCLKPKCHLAIPGCTAYFENHYSCCPSRYDCSQRIFSLQNSTAGLTVTSTTLPGLTTVTSTTLPETTTYTGQCVVDGAVYLQGDVVPNRITCHNCYCSDSNIVCEKIKCSPPLEGCQPIIPEGRCCPISYRCDYPSGNAGSNNIKGATLNDTVLSTDVKESDIKTVKNYFNDGNTEIRLKGIPYDGESIALLHNVIPIRRRLDEGFYFGENTTTNVSGVSPVYIGEELLGNTNNSDYLEVFNSSVQNRENDKTLTLDLNDTATSDFSSYDENLSLDDDFQTDHTSAPREENFNTKGVSTGSPEVHTLSIQQLFDQFFSRQQGSTPNFSDSIFAEPKRNNSKQPVSIVDAYNDDTHTTDSYTLSEDFTTKLKEILETIEDASIIAERIKLEPSILEVPYVNDTVPDITTEKSGDVTDSTNYIRESTFPNREQLTVTNIFSELPSTKTTDLEEFKTRKDTETTVPVFISTLENFFQHQTNPQSPLPVSTTTEDLTNQDVLETSPSTQIFSTTGNFDSSERLVTGQTNIHSSVYANTNNLHNADAKQTSTQPTSPSYSSTRNFNNEELETDFDTQPTILIYDFTKNFYGGPKVVTETYPMSVLFDSTTQFYDGELKKGAEIHPTSFTYTSNRNIFSEDLKKQTEIPSTYPVYITTKYPYTKDEMETRSTFPSYSNSKNRYSETFKLTTKPQYTSSQFTTFKDLISDEFQKLTRPELKPTTLTDIQNTNAGIFSKEIGTRPTSSIPTSTRNINDYSKDGEISSVPQTSHTPNFRNEELNQESETTKTTPTFSNPEEHSVSFGNFATELSTQKYLETAKNAKASTRINSKLPSLSYIEKANEKNNTVYSRFPVLTDSVVNVYLPPESRDTDGNEKDFTNVGSIFIGAPLSVGGTDARKDLNHGKPKITQSGGVIFMDPQYTDINTRTQLEAKTLKDTGSLITQMTSTSNEKSDQDTSNSDRKKGPRIQDSNQLVSGQGYKIIPFVAEDAVRNQFGKINSTMVVQQGSTEGVPDMVSDFCFIKGRIYMNGENIGKADPCEMCRCFYGREMCQIQRCPMPPDCIPEKVPGFCCPRFTCGNNTTAGEPIIKEQKLSAHVQLAEITTTTRKPDSIEHVPSSNNKQEVKFGIRVRTRPTQGIAVSKEHATEENVEYINTTLKPNISPVTSTTSTTTTTKKPDIIRTITNKKPEIKRTTTQSPLIPDPWGLLKVSGCNIYGKFFNINDQVEILSGPCSHCVCTTNGVECNDIC